jgi:triphosphoribosyl-dephospho-CoA synthase
MIMTVRASTAHEECAITCDRGRRSVENWQVDNGKVLADLAVGALQEEALLTPKPALVDARGPGAHTDLSLDLLLRSAQSLHGTFVALARAAQGRRADKALREDLAVIGREGEGAMLSATSGVNTHRGALWALGLLVASAAMGQPPDPIERIAARAGAIALQPDRHAPAPTRRSHGACVQGRYGVSGARGEAQRGFPHVITLGLPALRHARWQGVPKPCAQLDALLAIMASLEDTCLLYRGGMAALELARNGARAIITRGGMSTPSSCAALRRLDRALVACNASPGGSADLLAATLFLDRLERITDATDSADDADGWPRTRSQVKRYGR